MVSSRQLLGRYDDGPGAALQEGHDGTSCVCRSTHCVPCLPTHEKNSRTGEVIPSMVNLLPYSIVMGQNLQTTLAIPESD